MRTGRLQPWLFIAPALLLVAFFLVYPSIHTTVLSFFGRPYSARAEGFVGVQNYERFFTDKNMLTAFRNNALWVVILTTFTVSFGLIFAVLLDRVRYEKVIKSIVFIPMAISMVGASVIWKFIYAFRPAGAAQVGLLNAIVTAFGGEPLGWLIERPWINNLCLIIVGIWIWTGFCMVILSAAYKGIPKELLEAARIDGATELQVFWKVILPLLKPTLAVVTTTMVVFVLKIFDIVYVMTNGNFSTEVIANRMYKEMFSFFRYGRASAIAVILLLLIIPVMLFNIRRFREQEAIR
ncbi:carbohydrate ABC transporter permease [Candidatus Bipolaricaulota bacterium]